MRKYDDLLLAYLPDHARKVRKLENLTQEKMAERMHMARRSYSALERGENGFSATSLLMLLSMLPDDESVRALIKAGAGGRKCGGHQSAPLMALFAKKPFVPNTRTY